MTLSRRTFMAGTGGVLASISVGSVLPEQAAAAPVASLSDLALNRPVKVSSTAYAATPAQFAVDGLAQTGVKGSGWRAATADPQWIVVDLQARCRVEAVTLTFEGTAGDPAFDLSGGNPYGQTQGHEVLSSSALDFRVDTSTDGTTWRTVHQATNSPGGQVQVALATPVNARYVRLTGTKQANANPLGLNGFQVYGTASGSRPPATGWTSWGTHHGTPPALKADPDGTVPLESGWSLTMDDFAATQDGATLSEAGQDTSTWLPAAVPGTVLATLVEQGHFPDPVEGMNNLEIPEALSRHRWWYRRAFDLPKGLDVSAGRRVWLEFDGVNHQADAWLNGVQVGTLKSPFARASFEVTAALKAKNALAVQITPMPHPGQPGDKGDAGQAFVQSGKLWQDSPTLLSASGWDWMPAVRDRAAGIWNHVRLRSTGDAVLGDARVVTKVPDRSHATVAVTVPIRNAASVDRTVNVKAAFDGTTLTKTVTLKAGESTHVAFDAVTVTNPKLWWPNGYGDPALHTLTTTVAIGGRTSDSRKTTFGIREFGYSYDLPIKVDPATNSAAQTVEIPQQTKRFVRIQGKRRATGWGYSLWTLAIKDSAAGADLARTGTATASSDDGSPAPNAIDGDDRSRWASQYTDDQWIQVDLGSAKTFDRIELLWETAYAALFVVQVSDDGDNWVDVQEVSNAPVPLKISVNGVQIFCRGGNWGYDELLRRVTPERMRELVGMHRDMNFTMIRNWIGSSTREEFYQACDENGILVWNDFWEAGEFSDDLPGYVEIARDTIVRYRTHPSIVIWCGANEQHPPAGIEAGISAAVREEDDEILYLPDSAAGFVSGHGPYYWVDPAKYFDANTYDTFNFGFHTEIGMPTIPVVESMRNLVGDDGEEGWPIGTPWYHHDWSTHGNQKPETYLSAIDDRLGSSSGLEEFTRKAQLVNYENMRAMFEAWNAHLWEDASALLLWMSHPAWHSTVWQTYDYDLDVNGSYYGARKGCEAIHVQASQPDWKVAAINHTLDSLNATVTADLYDLQGKRLGAQQKRVLSVGASGKADGFVVAFGSELPALHLLRLTLTDAQGKVLSENTYWRYRAATDVQQLNALGKARLNVKTTASKGKLTAVIRNDGKAVAPLIRLSLRDRDGERVLPALYSDNYFWLLPGESRTVTVTANATGTLKLLVDPYNS